MDWWPGDALQQTPSRLQNKWDDGQLCFFIKWRGRTRSEPLIHSGMIPDWVIGTDDPSTNTRLCKKIVLKSPFHLDRIKLLHQVWKSIYFCTSTFGLDPLSSSKLSIVQIFFLLQICVQAKTPSIRSLFFLACPKSQSNGAGKHIYTVPALSWTPPLNPHLLF